MVYRRTEDVLKARLKTLGVVEHMFTIPSGPHRGIDWKIYDVGGSRNQRQAWAPYFEDGKRPHPFLLSPTRLSTRCTANAIIFLAPISAFDQTLAEVGLMSVTSCSIFSQPGRTHALTDSRIPCCCGNLSSPTSYWRILTLSCS